MEKNIFLKIKDRIEQFLPMTMVNLLLFLFVIYLLYVVSKSVWDNHQADQEIDQQSTKLVAMQDDIHYLENQINYYQTYSFKEKEAREKLGYKSPGENAMALPVDTQEEKLADSGLTDAKIKVPNYSLWWEYFFERSS